MKKKASIFFILALCLLLTACGHTHSWQSATCTSPKICPECGEEQGEALGHKWLSATCTEPKICSICGETSGSPLGHILTEATYNDPPVCLVCGISSGSPKAPSVSYNLRDMVTWLSTSSIYSGDNLGVHSPENMFDGKLDTNWTEDATGNGIGEYVTFYFDGTYAVNKFWIYIGSHYNEGVYKQNCRPKTITLTFSDGSSQRISLRDSYDVQSFTLDRYYYTDSITLTIDDVYTGTKYLDTVIAELDFVGYLP